MLSSLVALLLDGLTALSLQFENSRARHHVGPSPHLLAFLQTKAVNDFQIVLQGQLGKI